MDDIDVLCMKLPFFEFIDDSFRYGYLIFLYKLTSVKFLSTHNCDSHCCRVNGPDAIVVVKDNVIHSSPSLRFLVLINDHLINDRLSRNVLTLDDDDDDARIILTRSDSASLMDALNLAWHWTDGYEMPIITADCAHVTIDLLSFV